LVPRTWKEKYALRSRRENSGHPPAGKRARELTIVQKPDLIIPDMKLSVRREWELSDGEKGYVCIGETMGRSENHGERQQPEIEACQTACANGQEKE
jgi:hypothetical protein